MASRSHFEGLYSLPVEENDGVEIDFHAKLWMTQLYAGVSLRR